MVYESEYYNVVPSALAPLGSSPHLKILDAEESVLEDLHGDGISWSGPASGLTQCCASAQIYTRYRDLRISDPGRLSIIIDLSARKIYNYWFYGT